MSSLPPEFGRPMDGVPLDEHGQEEGVVIGRAADGRAYLVPTSMRRLGDDARAVVRDVQKVAGVLHDAQQDLRTLVLEARELGVSWNTLGWALGVTGEAVRQRFGGEDG